MQVLYHSQEESFHNMSIRQYGSYMILTCQQRKSLQHSLLLRHNPLHRKESHIPYFCRYISCCEFKIFFKILF